MNDCIIWKNDELEMMLVEAHCITSEDVAEIQKWLLTEKGYYIRNIIEVPGITFIEAKKAHGLKLSNAINNKENNK